MRSFILSKDQVGFDGPPDPQARERRGPTRPNQWFSSERGPLVPLSRAPKTIDKAQRGSTFALMMMMMMVRLIMLRHKNQRPRAMPVLVLARCKISSDFSKAYWGTAYSYEPRGLLISSKPRLTPDDPSTISRRTKKVSGHTIYTLSFRPHTRC